MDAAACEWTEKGRIMLNPEKNRPFYLGLLFYATKALVLLIEFIGRYFPFLADFMLD
jgi:hypothetical protein